MAKAEATAMTKSERVELNMLIRKRERVMKKHAEERAAKMLAEFDTQLATIYEFDDDAIWAQAVKIAEKAVAEAQRVIAKRCEDLGIPPEFAPGLSISWQGRGQNAVGSRRQELRRMAKSKIQAMHQEAVTKIEHIALEAQTEVMSTGLQTATAKSFLAKLDPIEQSMPEIDIVGLQKLMQKEHLERAQRLKMLGYDHYNSP